MAQHNNFLTTSTTSFGLAGCR